MKNSKQLLSSLLFIIVSVCILFLGFYLFKQYNVNELEGLSNSFQAIMFVLTTSIALLGLLKYWDAVSNKKSESDWNKYLILSEKFEKFIEKNEEIILAFEWEHKFNKVSNACKEELKYRSKLKKEGNATCSDELIQQIKQLDGFLEFYCNLYYALERKIINYKEIQLYFNYYITIVNNQYKANKYFKKFIDEYYKETIVPLIINYPFYKN